MGGEHRGLRWEIKIKNPESDSRWAVIYRSEDLLIKEIP